MNVSEKQITKFLEGLDLALDEDSWGMIERDVIVDAATGVRSSDALGLRVAVRKALESM